MKDAIWGVLFWFAIIGAFVLIPYSCARVQQRTDGNKKQRAENELAEFCKANNAIPAFKDLPAADLLTLDLQRSLSVREKRVGFKAKLLDLWRSKKYDNTIIADFTVNSGEVATDAFLKCTEAQASALADQYRRDKDTTFLLAAEFEGVTAFPTSDGKSDSEEAYEAIGLLVLSQVAKNVQD